jgi:hypothetical protein
MELEGKAMAVTAGARERAALCGTTRKDRGRAVFLDRVHLQFCFGRFYYFLSICARKGWEAVTDLLPGIYHL